MLPGCASCGNRHASLALSYANDTIVDGTHAPADNSTEEGAVEKPYDTSGPGDRIADEIVPQQVQMRAHIGTALDEQPRGHDKEPDTAEHGTDDRQYASLEPGDGSTCLDGPSILCGPGSVYRSHIRPRR